MAQPKPAKQQRDEDSFSSAERRDSPAPAADASAPIDSPALSLQARLADEWMERAEDGQRKWSPRKTLLFSAGVSAALWALIAWIVSVLF